MTKIDIISGFLGAGKTTLIKKLIEEALKGQKVVLIENEFGEIGIDGGFLKESGIQINEMNSGCICCSLVGDFNTALKDVLEQYTPDRIIIEPSGVGKLSDVMKAVQKVVDAEANVVLNSHITVADAQRAKMYLKNFGEFYRNQVEFASAVILSRSQNVKEDKLEKAVELLRSLNDKCPIVTTPWEELSGAQILEVMEGENDFAKELMEAAQVCPECGHHHEHGEECHDHHHDHEEHEHHHHDHEEHEHHHHHDHDDECGCEDHDHEHHHHDHDDECSCGCHDHEHHHHHADEVFSSWGLETIDAVNKDQLTAILEELAYGNEYGDILRAKGMLPGEKEGEWYYFDMVPEQYEIRTGAPDYTGKVCVIGANLKEDELKKAFGRNE